MAQQVSFGDVRNAVSTVLGSAFPDIPIRGEEINPNLDPPCFFVHMLEPSQSEELGRRHRRTHPFDVRYFPATGSPNEAMYYIAEQLTAVLRQIAIAGQPTYARGMRFEIVDGMLHFFTEYNFFVWEPEEDVPIMQGLKQEESLK